MHQTNNVHCEHCAHTLATKRGNSINVQYHSAHYVATCTGNKNCVHSQQRSPCTIAPTYIHYTGNKHCEYIHKQQRRVHTLTLATKRQQHRAHGNQQSISKRSRGGDWKAGIKFVDFNHNSLLCLPPTRGSWICKLINHCRPCRADPGRIE